MSELTYEGEPAEFRFSMTSVTLGAAVLLEATVPHLQYDRSARHVAAGNDDYLLVAYLRGEADMVIAGDELAMSAGAIGVVDLTCPSHSEVVPPPDGRLASHLSLLLPRAQLAPLLAAPDAVGGQLIRGDAGYGRILLGLLCELWRQAGSLDLAQSVRVTDAIAGLVAGALRPALDREDDVRRAELSAKRAAIQRYLDRQTDAIDIEEVCRRFALSRASLYRMFEADGGLVRLVRQRRLQCALAQLTSPGHRHRRIVDIALQHGFATESGFIRAFRRHFGISPGDARAAAADRRIDS
jgi:AraC-like DNA-binding protein